MDYKNLIEKRQSYRNFTNKIIEEKNICEIKNFFATASKLNDDISLQIFSGNAGKRLEGVVGYHGYAFEAPAYIVLMGDKKNSSYLNAGFVGMELILKLVEMNIDTCFLTVDHSDMIKKVLKIENNLTVLSVIACGYAEKIKDLKRLDIYSPSDVKFTKRKGYSAPKISINEMVYDGKWNNKLEFNEYTPGEVLEDAFFAASLAPYFFNKQNYKYILTNEYIILCDKIDKEISIEDRLIGMGCTMFNFYIIYSSHNHEADMWTIGKPDIDINIPDDFEIISYMKR